MKIVARFLKNCIALELLFAEEYFPNGIATLWYSDLGSVQSHQIIPEFNAEINNKKIRYLSFINQLQVLVQLFAHGFKEKSCFNSRKDLKH